MNLTLTELCEAAGGRLTRGNPEDRAGKLCTDTRILRPGEVFVALNGPNFVGAQFLPEAVRKGAQGAICALEEPPEDFPADRFFVSVPDATDALGDIAREWRRIVDPRVIAVTGSAGKTTTKEMLAFICRGEVEMLATEGNFNNLVGLPLTLLRLKEEHELAIIETGMSFPEELTRLTEICIPDAAVLTNIGNAHIGNFGNLEDLIRGEAEIFEAMHAGGTAILNADCPHTSIMTEAFPLPGTMITYGQNDAADVRATNVRLAKPWGYQFDLHVLDETHPVHLKMYGRFQVSNALAAAAAAAFAGVSPGVIAERLSEFNAPAMRAQVEWFDGVLIVSDCYNASPDAVVRSLWSFNDVHGLRSRVAVLGEMKELGGHEEKYHRLIGVTAAEAQLDALCTIGGSARFACEEAEQRGVAARHFEDVEELAEFLHRHLRSGDGLMIKGSRALRLENVLRRFREIRSAVREGDMTPTVPTGDG